MHKILFPLFLALVVCLGHVAAAARTIQQAVDGTGYATAAGGSAVTTPTPATTTTPATTSPSTSAEEVNVFHVFEISPWALGQNYSTVLYPGPDGLVVPVGAILAFVWGNATHGVYEIPTEQCPAVFCDGLNGMQAIQEPVNGLTAAGPTKTATYVVANPGVYYFACPVDRHCQRGMLGKVTAKAKTGS